MTDVHWLIDGWRTSMSGAPRFSHRIIRPFLRIRGRPYPQSKAYVCDMTSEETDAYRRLGKASNFRDRSIEEKSRSVCANEGGGISRRSAHVACEDRRKRRERLAARSSALSHPGTPRIIALGTNGAFIRCTNWAHTLSDYIEGITHSVLHAGISKCTGHSTIGFSARSNCRSRARINMNLRGSISLTRS